MAENKRLLARLKGIPADDHDGGSSGGAKRGRDKINTNTYGNIIEYFEFILLHPTMKEPLTVSATLSKRLRILLTAFLKTISYACLFL